MRSERLSAIDPFGWALAIADQLLTTELLLEAYASGYFPMADGKNGEISWYSPDPRAILELDALKISRSLRHTINAGRYDIRWDSSFEGVMRHCANRPETWISEEIIRTYVELQKKGFAHSAETWIENELVGGLYGVSLGGAFFGESMFSVMADASKVALAALVTRMRECGCLLLDVQFMTPHLQRLGATEMARPLYMRRLQIAIRKPCSFSSRVSSSNI